VEHAGMNKSTYHKFNVKYLKYIFSTSPSATQKHEGYNTLFWKKYTKTITPTYFKKIIKYRGSKNKPVVLNTNYLTDKSP